MTGTNKETAGVQRNLPSSVTLHFSLLGEWAVVLDGRPIPSPPHRAESLLAALLLGPCYQRRERLAALLFPNVPEHQGRKRLSHLLWQLRRWLPELPLETSAQEVSLPAGTVWVDVTAFRQLATGDGTQGRLEALALYRGDLLEGVYDDWLIEEREALYLQYVRLVHRACDDLLQAGQYDRLVPLVERLVQREPYDERALRALMTAYRAVGRRGAALAMYERFASLAARELGAEPEPATQSLAQAIRSSLPRASADFSRSISASDSTEAQLHLAREALARGDTTGVERILQRLHTLPGCPEEDIRLLHIDHALLCEDYGCAERLLTPVDTTGAVWRLRATQLAAGRHQVTTARQLASEALLLASQVEDRETELWALLALTEAQQQLGEGVRAMRSAERALALAQATGSYRGIARALSSKGFLQIHQGRYAQALSSFQDARSVALEHGLRLELALALRGTRLIQSHTSALGDALATAQEELSIWRDLGLELQEATALEGLAVVENHLGRSAASLRTMEQALHISQRLGEPVRVGISLYNMACSLVYHDDTLAPRALENGQQALDIFRTHYQPSWEAAALTILGYALWVDGQHGDALDHLRQAYASREHLGGLGYLPELLAYQGLACLGLGRPVEALNLTQSAILSLAQGEVSDEVVPEIHYAHACALSTNGREEQARGYFDQAYQLLIAGAAQIEDRDARQAFFHRNPTMRRLMKELRARGIAPPQGAGIVSLQLPSARGGRSVQVHWTVDAGPADVALRQTLGGPGLRRARLARLLAEANLQGAAPTAAHLAQALGVSKRTVQRDLATLRRDRQLGH